LEFKEENLKDLNKIMQKITKENQPFDRIELDYKKTKEMILMM
jgi:threonyl-tRNA synthetase